MAYLQHQAAEPAEADDNVSEDVPAPHAASARGGSARGRGRGRIARGKGKIAKPAAPAKPAAGRGRRHKMYESSRAQAAHERIQELKSSFAAVAKVVKPAVQEIADRTINELLRDPAAMQKVPEYGAAQGFLRQRLADTKRDLHLQLRTEKAMVDHVYRAQVQITHDEYMVRLNRSPYPTLGI